MHKNEIKQGSEWKYVGPGDGQGLKHTITMANNGTVQTWSEPINHEEIGGFAWSGSRNDFLRNFRPLSKVA